MIWTCDGFFFIFVYFCFSRFANDLRTVAQLGSVGSTRNAPEFRSLFSVWRGVRAIKSFFFGTEKKYKLFFVLILVQFILLALIVGRVDIVAMVDD